MGKLKVIKKSLIANNINALDASSRLAIRGVVKQQGGEYVARVRLYDKSSGNLLSDKKTNLNGAYIFQNLSPKKYQVVAIDVESNFNAVIQDNVVPK